MISLKEAREQRGLSVEELAAASNIDVATIEAVESGAQRPTVSTAMKLGRALDRSTSDIAELAPQMTGMPGGEADPLLGPRIGPKVGP